MAIRVWGYGWCSQYYCAPPVQMEWSLSLLHWNRASTCSMKVKTHKLSWCVWTWWKHFWIEKWTYYWVWDKDLLWVSITSSPATFVKFTLFSAIIGGFDFVPETALIRFDPVNSEPIICEMIELINDIFFEETEEFFVDLSSTDPVVTFIIQTASVFITNDDGNLAIHWWSGVRNHFYRLIFQCHSTDGGCPGDGSY